MNNFEIDRYSLETLTRPTQEFIDSFCKQLRDLIPHAFIATRQASFLNDTKQALKEGEYVVLGDFAENYTFVTQNEIQSAYFNRPQCTLHPFVIYYRKGEEIDHKSLLVISESTNHDVIAVYHYQQKLLEFMRREFATLRKISFFTDGAGGQYKNFKNFYNMCDLKIKEKFDVEVHFFATSHGNTKNQMYKTHISIVYMRIS